MQCIYVLHEEVEGKGFLIHAMKIYNGECRVAPILKLGGDNATLGPGHFSSRRAQHLLNRRQGGSRANGSGHFGGKKNLASTRITTLDRPACGPVAVKNVIYSY